VLTVIATLQVGQLILQETALSFLGLGLPQPTATWGNILAEGRDRLLVAPWIANLAGVAIVLLVLGINLLGNGLHALLMQREAWLRLQQEPALWPGAARELLRYDSPVQYTGRRVAADLVLHGQRLRRGDLVVALIGAANRDPRRHDDPDALQIARPRTGMLSFGHGPHVCIGAALSLMEAEIVWRQVARRWPGLRIDTPAPRWNGNPVYRGLLDLPLRNATAWASIDQRSKAAGSSRTSAGAS